MEGTETWKEEEEGIWDKRGGVGRRGRVDEEGGEGVGRGRVGKGKREEIGETEL